jgi:hypothetical protein
MLRMVLSLALVVSATSALADDGHHYVRARWVEADVSIERPEGGLEQASPNVPVLPGDRLSSDTGGRLELQTADGTLLQLDERSQLDYADHRLDDAGAELFVLRLGSGSLYLHGPLPPYSRYRIDTTHGAIETTSPGLLRIDTDQYETRLSVLEGEASLLGAGGQTLVTSWQQAAAIRGRRPAPARALDAPADPFAAWQAQRGTPDSEWPAALADTPGPGWPCAQELNAEGEWLWNANLGRQVWRPFVDRDWQPFLYGRWYWAEDDWVWVADEPWGWVPYHYGRWHNSTALGWYWIPGSDWAPAWVSWIEGEDYVGWSPEGLDVSLDVQVNVWVFAQRGNFNRHDFHRCRIRLQPRDLRRAHRTHHARLGHDLRLTTAVRRIAVPRHVPPAPSADSATHPRPSRPRGDETPGDLEQQRDAKLRDDEERDSAERRAAEEKRGRERLAAEARASKLGERQREVEQLLLQTDEQRRRNEQRNAQQRAERERSDNEQKRAQDRADQERRNAEQRDAQQRTERERRDNEEKRAQDRADQERRNAEQRDAQQRAERERRDNEEKRAQDRADQERRNAEQRDAQQRAERERRDNEEKRAQDRADQERRNAEQRDAQQRAERERRDNEEKRAQDRADQGEVKHRSE